MLEVWYYVVAEVTGANAECSCDTYMYICSLYSCNCVVGMNGRFCERDSEPLVPLKTIHFFAR
jgi:hypothetical protein